MIVKEILNRQLEDDDSLERFDVKSLHNSKEDNNTESKKETKEKTKEEVEPCCKKRKMTTLTNLTPSKYLTIGSKSVLTLKRRTTLPTSYYSKHQSKIKSQKKIIQVKEHSDYLDDINELVQDVKQVTRKNLKGKYKTIVKKLKVIRYNSKVAELVDAKKEIE